MGRRGLITALSLDALAEKTRKKLGEGEGREVVGWGAGGRSQRHNGGELLRSVKRK